MKSVIGQRNSIFLYLLEDIVMKQEIKMKVWPVSDVSVTSIKQ